MPREAKNEKFNQLLRELTRYQQEDILLMLAYLNRFPFPQDPDKPLKRHDNSLFCVNPKPIIQYINKRLQTTMFDPQGVYTADTHYQAWLTTIGIPFLINTCLSIPPDQYSKQQKCKPDNLITILKTVENLYNSSYVGRVDPSDHQESMPIHLIRSHLVQSPEQDTHHFEYGKCNVLRHYNIYKNINWDKLNIQDPLFKKNLNSLFLNIMTLLSIPVFIKVQQQYYWQQDFFRQYPYLQISFDHFSKTSLEFCQMIKNLRKPLLSNINDSLNIYDLFQEFNVLHLYPFIQWNQQCYLSVNPNYIPQALSNGLFYNVLDQLDNNKEQQSQELGRMFGESFEKYIHKNILDLLLQHNKDHFILITGKDLLKKNKELKAVDFILLSKDKTSIILLEVKTARLNITNKMFLDSRTLANYVWKNIQKGINQIQECENHLQQHAYKQYQDLDVTKLKFYRVLVIYEEVWSSQTRRLTINKIKEELNKSGGLNKSANIIFLNLEEVEKLTNLCINRNQDILSLLDQIEKI